MALYKSITELKEAVERGDVDEATLEVWIDNDDTGVYTTIDPEEPILSGAGYADLEELWKLVFPKAHVAGV